MRNGEVIHEHFIQGMHSPNTYAIWFFFGLQCVVIVIVQRGGGIKIRT
jgi:hypothetical protein